MDLLGLMVSKIELRVEAHDRDHDPRHAGKEYDLMLYIYYTGPSFARLRSIETRSGY